MSEFATTRWSIVASAGRQTSDTASEALQELCQTYWRPLYAFARRRTQTVEEAQDLTQAFFTEMLEKNYVAMAVPERGRFRAFLLTSFKNFMSKEWQKNRALKRGGGRALVSLDFEGADSKITSVAATDLTPEQIFDQHWVIALLHRILDRLGDEYQMLGQQERFETLKGFVIGDHPGMTFANAAESLEITEAAAKKSASRMRQRYRAILREEIAQTVSEPGEVDDEIRSLFRVFQED